MVINFALKAVVLDTFSTMSSSLETTPSSQTSSGDSPVGARRGLFQSAASRMSEEHQNALRLLRDDNCRLRNREVEISSLTVKLQKQLVSTQAQIDHLKGTIRLQLANPITEGEYLTIEQKPESQRDLLDTVKVGIYCQLGSLKASRDAAIRKSSEIALELESTVAEKKQLSQDIADLRHSKDSEIAKLKRAVLEREGQGALALEQAARIKDLESRLAASLQDQESNMSTRVELRSKINDLARMEILLKQAEGDSARFKAQTACAEQKLDILKSEYYELKLQHSQRELQLENALRAAEDKLAMMGDLELEADIFIANIAARDQPNGEEVALAAIPPSRKMQNAITVTKKCLSLENKLCAANHEISTKDEMITQLQKALELARHTIASHGGGDSARQAHSIVEDTFNKLLHEKSVLSTQNGNLRKENDLLLRQVEELQADLAVLSKHRNELGKIRAQLQQYAFLLQQPSSPSSPPLSAAIAANPNTSSYSKEVAAMTAGAENGSGDAHRMVLHPAPMLTSGVPQPLPRPVPPPHTRWGECIEIS